MATTRQELPQPDTVPFIGLPPEAHGMAHQGTFKEKAQLNSSSQATNLQETDNVTRPTGGAQLGYTETSADIESYSNKNPA